MIVASVGGKYQRGLLKSVIDSVCVLNIYFPFNRIANKFGEIGGSTGVGWWGWCVGKEERTCKGGICSVWDKRCVGVIGTIKKLDLSTGYDTKFCLVM